jgi:hypothetical protein
MLYDILFRLKARTRCLSDAYADLDVTISLQGLENEYSFIRPYV